MMNGAFRTGLFYALVFGGAGIALPFAALWFRSKGLNGAEISLVLASPMLARILIGPLLAVWGDGFRLRRTPLALLALTAAGAVGAMLLVEGMALWLLLWFVAMSAFTSLAPLADVLTLRLARREGFVFAVARSAGSVAFIVASVGLGSLLTVSDPDLIIICLASACAAAAGAALVLLPAEPVHAEGVVVRAADRFRGLGLLLGDRPFMTAIAAVGLIQAAHAFYYGFSTLVWRGQGISEAAIGWLWAAGVAAEVVFMWSLEPWRRRVGPLALLMLGGGGAALRWAIMALEPPLWALWPLQVLHALSFAASFLAGLQLVERLSLPQTVSVAQTLSSALSSGVLMGLATMLSGPLFDAYGAGGYAAMAMLAGIGVAIAFSLRGRLAEEAG